jgi:hypothetical protein
MRKTPNKIVLVAAAVAVAAAVLLTRKQEETTAKRFETKKLFEAVDIDQLGEVQIVDGDETITLRKLSTREWGVASRANFPVDDERLRRLVLSVLNLEAVDRLTSNPEKYPRLGVGDEPENGRLLLRDGEGQILAGLYLGKRRESKDTEGGFGPPRGQFVRAEDDPAVYVSNEALMVDKQPAQWLKRDLLSVQGEELSRIEVDHPNAAEDFILVRSAPEDPFELETAVPPGRKLKSGALGSVSRALANLKLEDVGTAAWSTKSQPRNTKASTTCASAPIAWRLRKPRKSKGVRSRVMPRRQQPPSRSRRRRRNSTLATVTGSMRSRSIPLTTSRSN